MLTQGTLLQDRYRVARKLASGGMGTVYEATDERLDAVVAIKETAFEDEELRGHFEREARLLARLSHPALPRVSDHFAEGGGQFLVMQFVEGEDLEAMRRRQEGGAFPVARVLAWADELLDALEYLHSRQPPVIHRDIKPQNLKLGARDRIILLDFGLAKGYASRTSPHAHAPSVHGGTPAYAPLEQLEGTGTDARSDLFSLAVTLYQLMTGVLPPTVMTRLNALHNNRPDPLRPAHEVSPHVSPEVSAALQGAMSVARDERPASAAEMRRRLLEAGRRQQESFGAAPTLLMTPTVPDDAAQDDATGDYAPVVETRPADVEIAETVPAPPAPPHPRRAWLIGGLAAVLLVGVVAVVLALKVFRASDSPGRKGDGTGASNEAGAVVNPSTTDANSQTPGDAASSFLVSDEASRTLKGHSAPVTSVVLSPDGSLLASGGHDKTVRLWDARTGDLRQTVSDLGDSTTRPVTFSGSGQTLAVILSYVSPSNECAIVLLDNLGGKLSGVRRTIKLEDCPVSAFALSPDGSTLATAASALMTKASSRITLWDTRTGESKRTLEGHQEITDSLAFSPDGATLASAGHTDGTVRLWNVGDGRVLKSIRAHERASAVAFSPDGKTFATGGYDGKLILWDAAGGARVRTLDYGVNAHGSSTVDVIAFSPDGGLVACGGSHVTAPLKVWDARSGALKASRMTGWVSSLAFSSDGAVLVCGTGSGDIVLFNVGRMDASRPGTEEGTNSGRRPEPTPRRFELRSMPDELERRRKAAMSALDQ